MGIGYLEVLLLRIKLGEDKFRSLLVVLDLLPHGQTVAPCELEWGCGGLPSAPGIAANRAFHGLFICQSCYSGGFHSGIQKPEHAVLLSREHPTAWETDRIKFLEQCREKKLAIARNVPGHSVFETDFKKWQAKHGR